ncbi:MAG: NAD(P)-binding domain-containing protein [Flavobacteriales bacterium]|jgi:thioredoxin reductase (NADPH)|nr:NAD(P)-binding domain-containing protein [Flavobacteriales bacterium]
MYEIIIIGAGPGGLSMAAEARTFGVATDKILIIEKAHEHSFTIKKYYPDNKLVTANFKGFTPQCTGVMCLIDSSKHETISYLDKTIDNYNLNVQYNETVSKIIKADDQQKFTIISDKGTYTSKTVAIAVGILGKPNKPSYKFMSSIKSRILFDLTTLEIKDSKVLVVGGGDSASEYCQFLTDDNNRNDVTLSYRSRTVSRMNNINKDSLLTLAGTQKVKLLFDSNIESLSDENGNPKVHFSEPQYDDSVFDHIVYALGGTTPENFLKTIGIEFNGPNPVLKEGYETNVLGLFLLGDLSAGQKGGSIIWAFNSANTAMRSICKKYL